MTGTPTDGIGRIRQKALLTNKRLSLARFTMECGLTTSQFHAFLEGKYVPPATVLQAMTKWFWPHATYDAARNELVAGAVTSKPKTLPSCPTRAEINGAWRTPEYVGLPVPVDKPKPTRPAGPPRLEGGYHEFSSRRTSPCVELSHPGVCGISRHFVGATEDVRGGQSYFDRTAGQRARHLHSEQDE